MAAFQQLALQYVLADDEGSLRSIADKAAREIETSHANSTVVGNWASSIGQWIQGTSSSNEDDQMEDGEESGDMIARAKALGFLADTLEALSPEILKHSQVQMLVAFFGSMFSNDHRAGITASTKALRQLVGMKNFKSTEASNIIKSVSALKEDFRLQTSATRREVYDLLLDLIQSPGVVGELEHQYGSSCGFILDLIQLCQNERDPQNLMKWFKLLRAFLLDFMPSADVAEEIFKTFSAYFPITLKNTANSGGVTAEDLKSALRSCFAAHQRIASLAFPFLMQRLDQGDAITVSIKVDILRTIKACIENYGNIPTSILPYIDKIWSSLKYEVRNGEVKETIDSTLEVLRALAGKLDGTPTQKHDAKYLKDYVNLVFGDSLEDLSNPTYTKQSGLLLLAVTGANARAFSMGSQRLIDATKQNLNQPKSPSHTRDLLSLLNALLGHRTDLVAALGEAHSDDRDLLEADSSSATLPELFSTVYLPTWRKILTEERLDSDKDSLKETVKGMALLVSQRTVSADGHQKLLSSESTCAEVSTLLSHPVVNDLAASANDKAKWPGDVIDELLYALRTVFMNFGDGFADLVAKARSVIQARDWRLMPSQDGLLALRSLLARVAFVGCSQIPAQIHRDQSSDRVYSPMQHFVALSAALMELFHGFLQSKADIRSTNIVFFSIHTAVLSFRDACEERYGRAALEFRTHKTDWLSEFKSVQADLGATGQLLSSLQQLAGIESAELIDGHALVYEQFLKASFFITYLTYRRVTHIADGTSEVSSSLALSDDLGASSDGLYELLHQLADLATTVIRSLDEATQTAYRLDLEAFKLFRAAAVDDEKQPLSDHDGGSLSVLTLGILRGLWPKAISGLYQPRGPAQVVLTTISSQPGISVQVVDVRNRIATVLANKYKPLSPGSASSVFQEVAAFWKSAISEQPGAEFEQATFANLLAVAAGAVPRQDNNVVDLINAVFDIFRAGKETSIRLAASMEVLVKESDDLSQENHGVVRRFYKQWAYAQFVKPAFPLALPVNKEHPQAAYFTIGILSLLKHIPFAVYQDDVESLVRLLITALSAADVQAAIGSTLRILQEVLNNESDVLKDHLKAIITSSVRLYEELVAKKSGAAKTAGSRRLVLQLLGELPQKFEDNSLSPYASQMHRMLSSASGDPVREVRKVALYARQSWARIS